jgi:hypothetical protein
MIAIAELQEFPFRPVIRQTSPSDDCYLEFMNGCSWPIALDGNLAGTIDSKRALDLGL